MTLGPRLDLRQTQSLVMTPQLRQAIKLLQFSNMEVAAFVEEELERNPLLERDESPESGPPERPAPDQVAPLPAPADAAEAVNSDCLPTEAPLEAPDYAETYDPGGAGDGVMPGRGGSASFEDDDRTIEDYAAPGRTLREHLGEQLRLSFDDPTERLIAAHLVALLEPSGRLLVGNDTLAAAMGTDPEKIERVRQRMLRFDPTGMFAHDLRECLAVQLAEKNRLDPAMQAMLDNLELLARHDHKRLMAACGVDAADLADMIAEIRRLDPKPGASFDATPPQPVMPDVLMRPDPEGGWLLELNPETMPRVLVNQGFSAQALTRAKREDRAFLTEKLQTANWLVKSLQQRAQTILKVASEIVRQQDAFFRHGVGHLRPLILRDIAAAVEMHESTVSRVTAHKYIATPRGIFELKYFFTTAIAGTGGESHSAEAVRHRIRAMVDAEKPDEILSDDAIVLILRREGVDIARRTVAKYREALRIPSSVQRKREKAIPA
ncbi:RNA polymerase factor sigma-54 [Rhodovastum atsumiense]|uniref:RNA polymerase sigma-54 factor n=1 Tax=Rhodovastum atsumiense TaxID=504468 RepID=A0A5M6J1P7_9PROT|nr:RNA polymerase factor sigma-54 [Rhodovastum atsumiense]KAA5614424.1 RNA polymerase factor sigma-54 [Rhodovastum atsumiense]